MAMTLVALVVAVLSTGFRAGIQTWRRLGEDTAAVEILSAVPAAVQRDVDFLAGVRPYGIGTAGRVLPFCATAKGMAFWSRYAPEGSPIQGTHLVAYVHDPAAEELLVYRVRVPLEEDPMAVTREVLSGDAKWGKPMGRVPSVVEFHLAYAEVPEHGEEGDAVWVDSWNCAERDGPPGKVRLTLGISRGAFRETGTWVFHLGIPQL